MTSPMVPTGAADAVEAPARPAPGAFGLFVLGLVDLALYTIVFAVAQFSSGLIGQLADEMFKATEVVWIVIQAVGVAFLMTMARGQKGLDAYSLLRTALGLAVASLVVALLQGLALVGGPSIFHYGHDPLGFVVEVGLVGLAFATDLVFWLALRRLGGEGGIVAPWMTPAYVSMRVFSALIPLVRWALPFEVMRAYFLDGPFSLPYRIFTLLLHAGFSAVMLVVLYRLHAVGVRRAGIGVPLAEPTPRASAQRDLVIGGLWLGGGLLVTLVSYSAASSGGGGRYIVTTGAIVIGLVRVVRGLTRLGAS